MGEQEWLASHNPTAMLNYLTHGVTGLPTSRRASCLISDRKLRLFACACWRLTLARINPATEPGTWEARERLAAALETAEAWADGVATRPNNGYAVLEESAAKGANDTVFAPSIRRSVPGNEMAALLRDVVGNPVRPVRVLHRLFGDGEPNRSPGVLDTCFITEGVRRVAQATYDDRRPDGTLDPDSLAVLADALEDAGCDNEAVLRHLRGQELIPQPATGSPPLAWYGPLRGPHVRGCWALDLILGKE